MENRAKVLIIQTAFIGDVLLTTPLIRTLSQRDRVHVLIIPATANVLENRADVERLLLYDKRGARRPLAEFFTLLSRIRRERYDLVVSPHRSLRSALIARLSGAPRRIGFDMSGGAFLYSRRVPYRYGISEVTRNLSLAESLGLQPTDARPDIYPSSFDREEVDRFVPAAETSTFIALAPGSVWATKKWPADYFKSLAGGMSRRGTVIVTVGGKDERELCAEIGRSLPSTFINAAGRLTLRQSAELLRRCAVLVSNDSAPMHLAVAVGTPVIALFGPTVPEFGFAPCGERDFIFEMPLSCRPCSRHGGPRCPIGSHDCMRFIEPGAVLRAVGQLTGLTV